MKSNRSIPAATVIPELAYADPGAAARWLCDTFGFRERVRIANHRIQIDIPPDGAMVARDMSPDTPPPARHGIMIRVDDIDAHYARATRAGATVVHEPQTHMYGERQYTVLDIGGHRWTFSQSVNDVAPESWGGETVR